MCRALNYLELPARSDSSVDRRRDLEKKRGGHVDGVHRISQIVRYNRNEVIARACRVLRRLVQSRVLERDRAHLRELRQHRFIALVESAFFLFPELNDAERATISSDEGRSDRIIRIVSSHQCLNVIRVCKPIDRRDVHFHCDVGPRRQLLLFLLGRMPDRRGLLQRKSAHRARRQSFFGQASLRASRVQNPARIFGCDLQHRIGGKCRVYLDCRFGK